MSKKTQCWAVVTATLWSMVATTTSAQEPHDAPPFTHPKAEEWLNSPPLRWGDLRSQVVLLDVWAAECWNCYRSIPWLQSQEQRYRARGLRVIGVHTPELASERSKAHVQSRARELGFNDPIMLDNDYSYWNALNNQYWPSFYFADRQGLLRGHAIGETHVGDANARQIEGKLKRLLDESVP